MAVRTIGLDIAKHVFQLHGADATGKAVLKKRLRREQLSDFLGSVPRRRHGNPKTGSSQTCNGGRASELLVHLP